MNGPIGMVSGGRLATTPSQALGIIAEINSTLTSLEDILFPVINQCKPISTPQDSNKQSDSTLIGQLKELSMRINNITINIQV